MAILEKKAERVVIRLPPEVCTFIATKTKSNVRELEVAHWSNSPRIRR